MEICLKYDQLKAVAALQERGGDRLKAIETYIKYVEKIDIVAIAN